MAARRQQADDRDDPTEPPKPEGPVDRTINVRDGKPRAGVNPS